MSYVGDSEVDAMTAAAAAVPFGLYTEGYRKLPVKDIPKTFLFRQFDELPKILSHIFSAEYES